MPRLWISVLETCQQWIWDSRVGSHPWAGWPGRQHTQQLGERPPGAAALVSGQASQHHHEAPRLPPALSSPDTSKVQAAGIFRVFTTSAKTEGEDLKWVWVIFRTLSITAVQWLLCSRRGDTIIPASFLTYHRLEQATSSRKGDQARKNYLPTPPLLFCHNNSFNFWGGGGKSGLLLWILEGCWVFRFRYSPRSQSGERIRVSNYSSHPRTQCSASHILTISKTRETTHTPTEYFYTHWKPHTKWKVIKQFGLKIFFTLNLYVQRLCLLCHIKYVNFIMPLQKSIKGLPSIKGILRAVAQQWVMGQWEMGGSSFGSRTGLNTKINCRICEGSLFNSHTAAEMNSCTLHLIVPCL